MPERPRGEVVTFYSFKGGVGRSMALANIAALEAQRGKRVLALDFDFEAPGLHRYFLKPGRHEPTAEQSGVLNLFAALRDRLRTAFPAGRGLGDADASSKLRALIAEEIDSGRYVYTVQLNDPNSRKLRTVPVDFIAAARFDGTYADLVRTFDWQGFYDDWAEVFPALVDELGSRYGMILVDSRTGVTDIGSICTMALPDKLVLVFSPNEQSLVGALDAGWQAMQGRKEAAAPREAGIFPLVSRVEEGEEEQKRTWIRRARESFEKLAGAAYGVAECDLEAYFDTVRVPHRGYYAYGERIAVEEQPVREAGSLAQMYDRLADCLECVGVLEAQRGLVPEKKAGAQGDPLPELLIKLLEAGNLAGRPSEAVRALDNIVARLRAIQVQGLPNWDMVMASALAAKAQALIDLYRFEEAINVYEEIIRLLGDGKDEPRRAIVDQAAYNLGHALANLGRQDDALTVYDRLIASFEGRTDAHAAEALSRALFAKGTVLRDQNKDADAIAVYDRLLGLFHDSPEPTVQSQVLDAMGNKASSLARLGDVAAATAIRDAIVRDYGNSDDAGRRQVVALAWSGNIATVAQQGKYPEVIAKCDEMLRQFPDDRDPEILQYLALALSLKSGALESLGRMDDALAVLDTVLARVGNVRSPLLATPVAGVLQLKSLYLSRMGRPDEARAARADLVRRFCEESAPFVQNMVAHALIADVREFAAAERFEEALAILNDLLVRFPASMDAALRKNFYGLLVARSRSSGASHVMVKRSPALTRRMTNSLPRRTLRQRHSCQTPSTRQASPASVWQNRFGKAAMEHVRMPCWRKRR